MEQPTEQYATREHKIDDNRMELENVFSKHGRTLTIEEVAKRLGISVEAAWALVVASLRDSRVPALTSEGEAAASPRRENDNSILHSAGFEPAEGSVLWWRDGTWYSREAALQMASRG